jgi:hypothetical protein
MTLEKSHLIKQLVLQVFNKTTGFASEFPLTSEIISVVVTRLFPDEFIFFKIAANLGVTISY